MAFPTSINGSISFRNEGATAADAERVAARIEEILGHARIRDISRHGNSVNFRIPVLAMRFSWDPLVAVSGGVVEAKAGPTGIAIAYRLGMTRLVIVATIMLSAMTALIAINDRPPLGLIVFIPIGWLWLVGGNYLLTRIRFPGWLERQLRKKPLLGTLTSAS